MGVKKIPESCSLLFNLLILLKSLGELFPSRGKLLTVVAPKESVAIFVFITFEDMLRKFTREHRTWQKCLPWRWWGQRRRWKGCAVHTQPRPEKCNFDVKLLKKALQKNVFWEISPKCGWVGWPNPSKKTSSIIISINYRFHYQHLFAPSPPEHRFHIGRTLDFIMAWSSILFKYYFSSTAISYMDKVIL